MFFNKNKIYPVRNKPRRDVGADAIPPQAGGRISNGVKITPALALRIGLGLGFVYVAVHMLSDPQSWLGFIPNWISKLIDPRIFLSLHSGFELILGILLLIGVFPKITSLLSFFDMFAILIFYGVDSVTFRDFGLMMASLALFLLSREKTKIDPVTHPDGRYWVDK